MTDDASASDPNYMPLCPGCGQPMKLVGLQDKAAKLGIRIPRDKEQYVIQCCGYETTIDDPEMAEIAFRNLKKWQKLAE